MSAVKPFNVYVGQRIRKARERLGLRQNDVAQLIGLQRGSIGNIETGTQTVSIDKLEMISLYLGRSVRWFLPPRTEREKLAAKQWRHGS